jgi:hypothetical protein
VLAFGGAVADFATPKIKLTPDRIAHRGHANVRTRNPLAPFPCMLSSNNETVGATVRTFARYCGSPPANQSLCL